LLNDQREDPEVDKKIVVEGSGTGITIGE
jgi:hypothetical protein